jgi:hypothetical protein
MVFAGNIICLAFWGSTKWCAGQWPVNKALFLFFAFSIFLFSHWKPWATKWEAWISSTIFCCDFAIIDGFIY